MFALFKKEIQKASFEDVQYSINYPHNFLLINTLSFREQECLIEKTVPCHEEEQILNELIKMYQFKQKHIIVYGKNVNDESVINKYNQIKSLGFQNVFCYHGGLFEWLLLQDIYGKEEFKTTTNTLDILKYKPVNRFSRVLF